MDLRGHGDSDATFSAYDDVAAGMDALALVEHLGVPAILIGNSMGAGATVWAATESPHLVAGLVLIGPFVRNPPIGRLSTLAFRLGLLRPWGPAVWNTYYRSLYPAGSRPTWPNTCGSSTRVSAFPVIGVPSSPRRAPVTDPPKPAWARFAPPP